nr:probable 1-acylglycerol-3-phosphate O-acyltransferase [Ipomoea batatas]
MFLCMCVCAYVVQVFTDPFDPCWCRWGGSSRPDFTCKSTEETEAWFIDSFEEWRKAKNLTNFILLGHSFGGYVASKYALKHPEHVQHLILVGSAGFTSETEHKSEWLTQFRATWKGAIMNHLWESNFTPQKLIRYLLLMLPLFYYSFCL